MLVTSLVEFKKSRYKVYLDYEIAFVLYKGDLRLYHIKENEEIDILDYTIILEEVLPKRAKSRCIHLLKSRDYTEEQLRRKLVQSGYPKCVIEKAIDYVKDYGYVDDFSYTKKYLMTFYQRKSKRKLMQELEIKGISKDFIQQALLEIEVQVLQDEDYISMDEVEINQINKLIKKKKYDPNTATKEETNKLIQFLFAKGYGITNIKRTLKATNGDKKCSQ